MLSIFRFISSIYESFNIQELPHFSSSSSFPRLELSSFDFSNIAILDRLERFNTV